MTAPALVLIAHGSEDPRVTTTAHAMRKRLQMMRPDLTVNIAFLDHCPPSGPQVVTTLANRGVREIVLVPLSLTAAVEASGISTLVARIEAAHPNISIAAARPIGPAAELLTLLDDSVRATLRASSATQLDALVLAAPDTGDARGAALLARRARQWASHHRLPCLVAQNDASGAGTAFAVATLRAQGRRHIAVGSLWLDADDSFTAQAREGLSWGAFAVSPPFGAHERLLELALARYAWASMSLMDHDIPVAAPIAL